MGFNLDDYEPVAARLDRWLKDVVNSTYYPCVITHMVSEPGANICVMKAELWIELREGGEDYRSLRATGYAEEVRGEGNVNRSSHVENCETSAIGRALANAGYAGSDMTKRPSREEIAKVQRMTESGNGTITESSNLASDKQQNMIRAVCKSMGKVPPHNLQAMTKREASAYIDTLKAGEQPAPTYDSPEEPF